MPIEVASYTPSVQPGAYQAVCTDVVAKASKDGGEFRVWEFTLDSGATISGSSSMATSPKSKGGKWLAALLGRTPQVGESVEPIGQRCTVIVGIKDTTGYEYVETVAAPTGPAKASPVKPLKELTENAAKQHAAQEGDELPF